MSMEMSMEASQTFLPENKNVYGKFPQTFP
jgi:hypothetical protein